MPGLLREVRDLRFGAKIFEQLRAAQRPRQPRHAAVGIVEIAEHDRRGRTRLRTRRLQRAVGNRAVLGLGGGLRRLDALDAEGALLHHPDRADRDVGIELQLQWLVPLLIEEVEEAHVVGARVGAVAGADAAVVDLRVEAVLVPVGGVGRAHRLARGVVAVLAEDRAELHPHVREVAFVITLDADPVHGAAPRRLEVANGGNVVFGMARRDAGFAARALVEIDRHAPPERHVRSQISDCRLISDFRKS